MNTNIKAIDTDKNLGNAITTDQWIRTEAEKWLKDMRKIAQTEVWEKMNDIRKRFIKTVEKALENNVVIRDIFSCFLIDILNK